MKSLIAVLLFSFPFKVMATTNASSLKLKIYQISVSANTDCSNPITILSSASGTETDFMSNPVIGTGSVPDDTYPCLMITMDDVIKYTPATNTGACSSSTEYTADLCRDLASSGGAGNERWSFTDLLEGTTVTPNVECAGTSQSVTNGGIANKVTLYLRTTAAAVGSPDEEYVSSWKKGVTTAYSVDSGSGPSVDTDNGVRLISPFVVSGSSVGVFYADSTGMVENNDNGTPGDPSDDHCEMNGVLFGFRDP